MAIQIEVMYDEGDRANNKRYTKTQRVDIRLACTLKKTNVLYVILSATTTAARARVTIDGVPKERVSEWVPTVGDENVFQDVCIVARRGDDFCLEFIGSNNFSWIPESEPLLGNDGSFGHGGVDLGFDEAVYFYATKPDPAVAKIARAYYEESMH